MWMPALPTWARSPSTKMRQPGQSMPWLWYSTLSKQGGLWGISRLFRSSCEGYSGERKRNRAPGEQPRYQLRSNEQQVPQRKSSCGRTRRVKIGQLEMHPLQIARVASAGVFLQMWWGLGMQVWALRLQTLCSSDLWPSSPQREGDFHLPPVGNETKDTKWKVRWWLVLCCRQRRSFSSRARNMWVWHAPKPNSLEVHPRLPMRPKWLWSMFEMYL